MPDEEPYQMRCWLTFPARQQLEKPLIWQLSQKFRGVVFDIRQASVQNEIGLMAVSFSGVRAEVDEALDFLRANGVQVDPIEKTVVEG